MYKNSVMLNLTLKVKFKFHELTTNSKWKVLLCKIVTPNTWSNQRNKVLTDGWIWHDNHDVSVGGEYINEDSKGWIAYFHALKGRCHFATA